MMLRPQNLRDVPARVKPRVPRRPASLAAAGGPAE
jgi:hypothetical protein